MVPGGVEPPQDAGVIGVNFLLPWGADLAAIEEAGRKARVCEFFYAWPTREPVEAAHASGALAAWQVGSAVEAVAAVEAGCDFVVAQGTQAGGHVRGELRLDDVLRAILDSVDRPVVAAGGIATAERVAEVIAAGAHAVRVGTRFVAATESGAHADYVAALIAARGAEDTALTTQFCEGWPDAPHRVLRSALEQAKARNYHQTYPPSRGVEAPVTHMALYAGEGVGEVRDVRPAADIVAEMLSLLPVD
jgi:NAD(P)H-dependent flavin oxidoreductase YrpB (nitropropane dioxygenase family)